MDGQTDVWKDRKIMLLSHTLITRGSYSASLVKLCDCLSGGSLMDRWTDRQTDGKNNVAFTHPYHVGSHVPSLVK